MLILSKHQTVHVPKTVSKKIIFTFLPIETDDPEDTTMDGWYMGEVPDNVATYLFNVARASVTPDYIKAPDAEDVEPAEGEADPNAMEAEEQTGNTETTGEETGEESTPQSGRRRRTGQSQ